MCFFYILFLPQTHCHCEADTVYSPAVPFILLRFVFSKDNLFILVITPAGMRQQGRGAALTDNKHEVFRRYRGPELHTETNCYNVCMLIKA